MTATAERIRVGHAAAPYRHSHELLADELHRLDALLRRRVVAFRAEVPPVEESAAHHLYVTDAEVDRLLAPGPSRGVRPVPETPADREPAFRDLDARIDARTEAAERAGTFLSLPRLVRLFGLSPEERLALVVCLAPELDRKYDRIYAFLQDDLTRKRPSLDLVLDLLAADQADRWRLRGLFSRHSPLFRASLLEPVDDAQSPSGSSDLARFLHLDRRCLDFLLEQGSVDPRLEGVVRLLPPGGGLDGVSIDAALKERVMTFVRHHLSRPRAGGSGVVVHLHGPGGVGKGSLARAVCSELGLSLLRVDGDLLAGEEGLSEERLRRAFREGLLLPAGVMVDSLEGLGDERRTAGARLKRLAAVEAELGGLTFLAGREAWVRRDLFQGSAFLDLELPTPALEVRLAAWESELGALSWRVEAGAADRLARQFRLTPGQIAAACREIEAARVGGGEEPEVTAEALAAACRRQSGRELASLAVKIEPRYRWEDLVLPPERLELLREICAQVDHRHRVFGDWGFGRKLSHGKGLSALFSGPPGTGKTMAAEVIARELQLDLFKVDLSGVVSKYIGETEKNLARIFGHAERANAILFFDEADALFGKRTEVSDAHDRYANIETSYLLQKMEEYEGMVILASNLRQNMDDAFVRRLRFIVDFPFPTAEGRREIWRSHLPPEAPCSGGIDCALLAERFKLAGGNIKNVVLNAAFLAAGEGEEISMHHLLRGTRREFEKIGKLWKDGFEEGL